MSIQKQMVYGVAIALMGTIQSARGADGRPSQDTLSQMGLGGLVAMADTEAESVRGLGFNSGGSGSHHSSVSVSGSSYATIDSRYGNAHSDNDYSSDGNHYASGKNNSHAGVEITTSHGNRGHDNGGGWNGGNSNGGNSGGDRWCGGGNSQRAGCGNSNPGGGGGNSHPGGGNSHHGGGGGYGRTTVTTIKVFAGGSSSAKAW